MKATGIVRRIDDLGRVVVPKEIRRILRIREGDPLEIFTGNSGEIVLKKYSPISDMNQVATEFAETAAQNLGCTVAITDTDMFIASSGKEKRLFANSKIDEELDYQIQTKEKYESPSKIIVPILAHGDVIGSIIMIANEDKKLSDVETKTAQIGAEFIAKQLYS
ncbi:MAG: stage V sporulation T C-terminal domain-containing protein [Eubacteriaceae bacterium]|nr:stage V sporulation T C-terminal domain-containing protein [Eubacteriaceae bacterium]